MSERSDTSDASDASDASDIEPAALAWIERFAADLGVPAPDPVEVAVLLDLAGTAAHASHRQAAPVACWLAALAGVPPSEALERARRLDG